MHTRFMKISALTFLVGFVSANNMSAAESDLESLPEFDCVIEPSEIVDLGTAVPGVIGAIYAERSDTVEKGEIVARLDSSVEIATVKLSKARAELNTSIELRQASAGFGNRTRERNQPLFKQSSISEQAIDKLETENRIAQLQVHQERDNKNIADLEYLRAKAVLDRHVIRTPFEGVVMERFKSVGEYIEDDPLMRVARLDPLNVEVILPVEYMGQLEVGVRAEVTPILPDYPKQIATVTLVDQVADAASGTFGTRLTLPNPDHELPSGLRCRLAFLPPEEPADALLEMERVAALTRDLPASEGATVVERMSQFDGKLIEPGASIESAPHGMTNSGKCYRVGPLANELLASRLLNTLSEVDPSGNSSINIVNDNNGVEYLVMTAAQPDERASRDLAVYLNESGVGDVYRLRSGRYKGRISLGLYEKEVDALVRQDSLRSIGIDAEMLEVSHGLSTYWVNMSLTGNPESQTELRTVATSIAPGAKVERTQCEQWHIARSDNEYR